MISKKLGKKGLRLPLLGIVALTFLLSAAGQAEEQAPPKAPAQIIETKDLSVELAADGRIVGILFRKNGFRRKIEGGTRLEGCSPRGKVAPRNLPGGVVEFETALADKGGHECRLVERFSPAESGVRWEVEITGRGGPWSTGITTWLHDRDAAGLKFWSPWGDSRQGPFEKKENADLVAKGVLPGVPVGDWADPLVPMPFVKMSMSFGAPAFTYDNPGLAFIPLEPDLFGIPLATMLDEKRDVGLSLALSPADPYLELTLSTDEIGNIAFGRSNHRIQEKKPLKFTAHLIAHEADWRGGLRWMTRQYPEYFDPAVPCAEELAGTAAYSTQEGYLDVAKLKKMAFRTNWKASYDFPYPGMFLPPVENGVYWGRFGGGATSVPRLRDYSRSMRQKGFYVLNYFNVTEFGAWIAWPPPTARTYEGADLWKDANDYLYGKLADAILYVPSRTKLENLKVYHRTRPDGPYFTWEGGIILDPGEPVYQNFLLDQARRHVTEFPESSGICIDRMDWLRMYNERRDDGASWFEGVPARAMANSWRDLMAKLGPLMHDAGKAIFVNNHTKRIDLLRATDGFFDEFTYNGVSLNLTALLGVRKPVLGWTSSADDLKPDFDAYFQRFLYLGVFPMAPYPMNDHSIEPREPVDRMYLDYGPLLEVMRGKKWVLSPHVINVEDRAAKVNIFQVPGGYAIPVVFGGNRKSVIVRLHNLEDLGAKSVAKAVHPGRNDWVPVAVTLEGPDAVLEVPLFRSCAMVRIENGRNKE